MSSCLNHRVIGFQLAKSWLTTFLYQFHHSCDHPGLDGSYRLRLGCVLVQRIEQIRLAARIVRHPVRVHPQRDGRILVSQVSRDISDGRARSGARSLSGGAVFPRQSDQCLVCTQISTRSSRATVSWQLPWISLVTRCSWSMETAPLSFIPRRRGPHLERQEAPNGPNTEVILAGEFPRRSGRYGVRSQLPPRARNGNRTVMSTDALGHFQGVWHPFENRRVGRGSVAATFFVNAFTTRKSSEGEVQHA